MFIAILIIHLLCCLFVLFGILLRVLNVHKYMFFVALFLPFWGTLIVLLLHLQITLHKDGGREIGVEKLKLESEIYKSIAVDDKKIAATTVPIEEALIINSAKERRSIIMDVLNDNPREYIEFLQKAGNNEDTEVVHYAVTAMVEIAKENDDKLQQFERLYALAPDNPDVLTAYTDFLWSCLEQNLMQGQVEVMNRELFASLMQKKLAQSPSAENYSRLITNELRRGNLHTVGDLLTQMEKQWPTAEQYWLLKLAYLAERKNGDGIRTLIDEIENKNVYMTGTLKEALAFWGS